MNTSMNTTAMQQQQAAAAAAVAQQQQAAAYMQAARAPTPIRAQSQQAPGGGMRGAPMTQMMGTRTMGPAGGAMQVRVQRFSFMDES
jgi:hypothetical protein